MSEPSAAVIDCPDCGAANSATNAHCWLCGRELATDAIVVSARAPVAPVRPPQFALSTLMMIVTLICVCLGLLTISPGLIVPLVAVVVPALVRTVVATRRLDRKRGTAPIENRISAFLASVGIVILTWITGLFTFLVACFVAIQAACAPGSPFKRHGDEIIWIGLIGGGLLAIVLMIVLLRVTWPKRT